MKVDVRMEVRHHGQRSQVMAVREVDGTRLVDIIYLAGTCIGHEVTVREDQLERLDAVARPDFSRLAQAARA